MVWNGKNDATRSHRPQHFIADVEVIMGEAAALVRQDAVVRVGGGIFRHRNAEGRALLHALEDEVDPVTVGPDHAPQEGQHVVFFAHPLLGPFDRQAMVVREGINPGLVAAVRRLNTSLSTAATPTTRRKKCTTCSGRDKPLR